MTTIYILWLRQLKRYVRSKARILGSLGQPLLFLLVFSFGFGPVFQKAGEGSYFQFLTPGIIVMSIIFTALFSGIEIIWDRQFGFLKETLVAPVSRLEIMIGRTLGGATVAIIQGVFIFIISLMVGFEISNPWLLPLFFVFLFLTALLFTAVGTAIASLMEDMHGFQLIMNFLIMPLFFLSGAFFPIENLPKAANLIIKINPLSYGVDGIRGTLIGASSFGMTFDLLILGLITLVSLSIGGYLFSKIQI